MKQYLTHFGTNNEYILYKHTDAPDTHVAFITSEDEVIYAHKTGDEYLSLPLTAEITDTTVIKANISVNLTNDTTDGKEGWFKISYDNKTWTDHDTTINLPPLTPVYIATNRKPVTDNSAITADVHFKLSGNILSLGGGFDMDIPEDVTILWPFAYNSNLADVENLWLPDFNYNCFNFENTQITKAPHISIGKINYKENKFLNAFKNTSQLSDISNIVLDMPKELKMNFNDVYSIFSSMYRLEPFDHTNDATLSVTFPEFLYTQRHDGTDNFHDIFNGRKLNITFPTNGTYWFNNNSTSSSGMFANTVVTDLSDLHICIGPWAGNDAWNMFAGSTVQKLPKIYIDYANEGMLYDIPNLTDVYLYGVNPDFTMLGVGESSTPALTNVTIHYAPWINSGKITEFQEQGWTAVEDTDAVMLTVMDEAGYEGDRWTIDNISYTGGRVFHTDNSYPTMFHWNDGETDGIEFLDNHNFLTHVIIGDEWVPVTYIEDTYLYDSEDYWDSYNFHKYSYTYNNATHYMYFARLEGGLGIIRDNYLPFRLVYSKNLTDSFKFKYINYIN